MPKPLPKFLNAYLPPLLWASLIFVISSQSVLPGVGINALDFLTKKMGHITVYAILWWLLHRAFTKMHPKQPWLATWLSLGIVLAYAISDEFHQGFVPGRYPSYRDIGYDMLGASIPWLWRHSYI